MDLTEVTPAWLTEVLGMPVAEVDVEPIGAVAGFLGQLGRARLTSSDPAVLDDGRRR